MATLLPFVAFLIGTVLCYGLARLLTRGGSRRRDEVFADGEYRPLWFGPLTHALAGLIPSGACRERRCSGI